MSTKGIIHCYSTGRHLFLKTTQRNRTPLFRFGVIHSHLRNRYTYKITKLLHTTSRIMEFKCTHIYKMATYGIASGTAINITSHTRLS